jgi:hypothetical protein
LWKACLYLNNLRRRLMFVGQIGLVFQINDEIDENNESNESDESDESVSFSFFSTLVFVIHLYFHYYLEHC